MTVADDSTRSARRGQWITWWVGTNAVLGAVLLYPILLSIQLFEPESKNPSPLAAEQQAWGLGLVFSSATLVIGVGLFLFLQVFFRGVLVRMLPRWFWTFAVSAVVVGMVVGGPLLLRW